MKIKLNQISKFRVEITFITEEEESVEMIKNRTIEEINTYIDLYGIDEYFLKNWIEPRYNIWEIM